MENEITAVNQMKSWMSANRDSLLKTGIIQIIARYSGEGDAGSLENEIEFLTADERLAKPYESEVLTALFEQLHDELSLDGYQNSEGGGGEFQIDVARGVLTHESYFLSIERCYNAVEEY